MQENEHEVWMQYAIKLAENNARKGEVPIAALIVNNGQLLAQGWNQTISSCDPTAHAEIIALRSAAKILNNHRLHNCTLYVTTEPCLMCTGAIGHARIENLVFGASDPKLGASTQLNKVNIISGVLEVKCQELLYSFFKARR